MDGVYRRAFDVLTSDKVARALDVSREDPRLRDRYGIGSPQPPGRRRPDVERPVPDRPPTGRGRGAVRHGRLRLLGHARRQLRPAPPASAAVRPGDLGPGRGHPQPRAGPRRHRGRLGRVRPDAQDQQDRRPRPLGPRELGAALRRRHEGRPGHRLDRQAGRLGRQPAGPLPGRPGHHLPQPGHRPPRLHPATRPTGPSPSSRPPPSRSANSSDHGWSTAAGRGSGSTTDDTKATDGKAGRFESIPGHARLRTRTRSALRRDAGSDHASSDPFRPSRRSNSSGPAWSSRARSRSGPSSSSSSSAGSLRFRSSSARSPQARSRSSSPRSSSRQAASSARAHRPGRRRARPVASS